MAGFLSGVGTLSYNGFTFPNQLETRVSLNPVMTDDGRNNALLELRISTQFYLHDGLNTGGAVNPFNGTTLDAGYATDFLDKITSSGKTLIYSDKGLGDDNIWNTSKLDVAYGPHPQLHTHDKITDNNAVLCTWSVVVRYHPCFTSSGSTSLIKSRLVQLNYGASWSINEEGMTQRTFAGVLETVGTRKPGSHTRIEQTADQYRDRFNPAVPVGFLRVQQNFEVSPDKKRLSFTIVDQESPSDNPYYPGTIRPNVSTTVTSNNKAMRHWQVTIAGSIDVAKGVPKWYAWAAFLLIVKAKRAALTTGKSQSNKQARIIITDQLQFSNQEYGRGMSFSISWLLNCNLQTVLRGSGIWATHGGSWAGHNTLMTSGTQNWSNRGFAQMRMAPGDDAITDLCYSDGQTLTPNNITRVSAPGLQQTPVLTSSCPPASESWINFHHETKLVRGEQNIVHYLQTPPETDPTKIVLSPGDTGYNVQGGAGVVKPILEKYAESRYAVVFTGWAMRSSHAIPEVHLQTYGGRTARPIGSKQYQTHKKLVTFDCDVYVTRWHRVYILDGKPNAEINASMNIQPEGFN